MFHQTLSAITMVTYTASHVDMNIDRDLDIQSYVRYPINIPNSYRSSRLEWPSTCKDALLYLLRSPLGACKPSSKLYLLPAAPLSSTHPPIPGYLPTHLPIIPLIILLRRC